MQSYPEASCGVKKDNCSIDLEVFRFGWTAEEVEQLTPVDLGIKIVADCGVEKESCFLVRVIGFNGSYMGTELSDGIFIGKGFDD